MPSISSFHELKKYNEIIFNPPSLGGAHGAGMKGKGRSKGKCSFL